MATGGADRAALFRRPHLYRRSGDFSSGRAVASRFRSRHDPGFLSRPAKGGGRQGRSLLRPMPRDMAALARRPRAWRRQMSGQLSIAFRLNRMAATLYRGDGEESRVRGDQWLGWNRTWVFRRLPRNAL